MTSRYVLPGAAGIREVSSNAFDIKTRINGFGVPPVTAVQPPLDPLTGRLSGDFTRLSAGAPLSARSGRPSVPETRRSLGGSPRVDERHQNEPPRCWDLTQDIMEMFAVRERNATHDPNYLSNQTEVNEKMRSILVDWLVDVHMKFKLHEETFFLAVDVVDRYLSVARAQRSTLQLIGVTSMLLAAKYEEMWAPEIKDCQHISANTYTRDDILKMERAIMAALSFRLTTPTPYPFLVRLFELVEADDTTQHAALFFLEHAVLDYKHLKYLPSQLANASMFIANVMLKRADPWSYTLQYYSKANTDSFKECARDLLEFTTVVTNSKYQAIRRKFSSPKYSEVSRMLLPTELPL